MRVSFWTLLRQTLLMIRLLMKIDAFWHWSMLFQFRFFVITDGPRLVQMLRH